MLRNVNEAPGRSVRGIRSRQVGSSSRRSRAHRESNSRVVKAKCEKHCSVDSLAIALTAPLAAGLLTRVAAQQGGRVDPSLYSGLRWRMIGPFRGGRVNGVSGVPGQPDTSSTSDRSAAASGRRRTPVGRGSPIFDSQPIASIGAVAVAPSKPNVVYVGTGEADMRSQISHGNGCTSPTDAGKTLDAHRPRATTRQIGTRASSIRSDPDVVFVAALGHVYGANPDRGVYRTRDGGATWQKVLFKSNDVGAIDLSLRSGDVADHLRSSLWNTRRPPWSIYPPSYGPGSGLYKSTDGGANWQQLTSGLPTDGARPHRYRGRADESYRASTRSSTPRPAGCTDPTMPARRSRKASATRASGAAAGISGRSSSIRRTPISSTCSNTGVVSIARRRPDVRRAVQGSPGGDDYHQLVDLRPRTGNRMILGGDQGAVISVDGLNDHPTWSSWLNQPTAQVYRDRRGQRVSLLGDRRAAGQRRGPRPRSRGRFAGITMRDWEPLCAGGESRLHRARSAEPRHRLRRDGREVQRRDRQDRPHLAGSRSADAAAPHVDAAAGVLAGGSARAVFQRSVSVQDHRTAARTGRASATT